MFFYTCDNLSDLFKIKNKHTYINTLIFLEPTFESKAFLINICRHDNELKFMSQRFQDVRD